jgi:hypothetical protein
MARDLHADFSTAVQLDEIHPIMLFKVNTSGGDVRVWSGIGDLTYDSETYIGTGTFGGVSATNERTDLTASGVTLSLSGIPSSLVSTALGQVQQGRLCQVWMALLNTSTGALVDDPYELFAGFSDVTVLTEQGETSTISIQAENRLVDLERARIRRYTDEDQKSEHSADIGFKFVPSLQDKVILFGKS